MPKEFDSCVQHVKGRGGVKNPFAVCRASMGSDKEIAARGKHKPPRKRKKEKY